MLLAAITEMYEQMLRQKSPEKTKLLYALSDVIDFIDGMQEVVLLVYDKAAKGFQAHGKSWVKALILSQTSK